jgi:2-polyprenyl-3-methyl-5-hydroxy-6-metoxy-1,4-benzoquinol methylase/phage gp45-like
MEGYQSAPDEPTQNIVAKRVQHYGFTSEPPDGAEVIAVAIGGGASNRAAIAETVVGEPEIQNREVLLWSQFGQRVLLDAALQIRADNGNGGLLVMNGETTNITQDAAITHAFHTEADWQAAVKAFDTYARTNEEKTLRTALTPGRVRKAFEWCRKVSENGALENYRWRQEISGGNRSFTNDEDYLQYRHALADAVKALPSQLSEAELHESLFATFKRLVDEKKEVYTRDVERHAAEMRLLQPIIVSVGKSRRYQEAALETGADAILPELPEKDIPKLIALANRMRTSPASIARERMRRNKSEFYRSVAEEIEARSEQTADIEKELQLLDTLFQKVGAKKVLDVGCGYGRLAQPLAVQGYDVTGIDGSRTLLERAKVAKGSRRNIHYKQGDIVEYRDAVKKESYDAVYYGWHSFLEAYGLGNALASLHSARHALKPGGIITFDQPSRENPGLEEGWYGDKAHGYLAYLMDDDELDFLLRSAGFEDFHTLRWTSKPSSLYPEGMKKITVVARKPELPTSVPPSEAAESVGETD